MEHDADGVWMYDFLFIVKDLLKKTGIDPKEFLGLGVSSICSAMLLLDKERKPLRPSILYGVDTRTTVEVEEIKKTLEPLFPIRIFLLKCAGFKKMKLRSGKKLAISQRAPLHYHEADRPDQPKPQ